MGQMYELRKTHGLKGLVMRYEDGGKAQIFKLGDREIKLGPMATISEIVAAFKEESDGRTE